MTRPDCDLLGVVRIVHDGVAQPEPGRDVGARRPVEQARRETIVLSDREQLLIGQLTRIQVLDARITKRLQEPRRDPAPINDVGEESIK